MRIKKTIIFVLLCSLLISGCSQTAVPANTAASSVDASTTTTAEVTTTTSYNPADYPFIWDYNANVEFDKYLESKIHISMQRYVQYFGFDEVLQQHFTDFCNRKYGLNSNSVPFSKANYFYDYVNDLNGHHKNDDYDYFKATLLNKECVNVSMFANKLVMSYLVQNKIPFGTRIPLENLKAIMGEDVYTYDPGLSEMYKDMQLGNKPRTYKYSAGQLYDLLKQYNYAVYLMCVDEQIKTGNPVDNIQAFEIHNKHLISFYGENAPQIGEVVSPEQYEKIWGEKSLDISYIQGALVK